jgi:hypothetical protein
VSEEVRITGQAGALPNGFRYRQGQLLEATALASGRAWLSWGGPPGGETGGNGAFDFLHQSGAGDGDGATGFDEAGDVVEVELVGAVIDERIDGENGIEETDGKQERAGVGMDGEDAVGESKTINSAEASCAAVTKWLSPCGAISRWPAARVSTGRF